MSAVGRYRDAHGLVHWAASDSKNTLDKLASGEFVDIDAPDPTIPEPPRSGAGSGVEAWREYAPTQGVSVTEDMKRDDIVAAVDASREVTDEASPGQPGDDLDTGTPDDGSGVGERSAGALDDRAGSGSD